MPEFLGMGDNGGIKIVYEISRGILTFYKSTLHQNICKPQESVCGGGRETPRPRRVHKSESNGRSEPHRPKSAVSKCLRTDSL